MLFVHYSFSSVLSRLNVWYFPSRDTHPTWTSMKRSFLQLGHTHVLSQRTMVSKKRQSTLDQSWVTFMSGIIVYSLSIELGFASADTSVLSHLSNVTTCRTLRVSFQSINATRLRYSYNLKISHIRDCGERSYQTFHWREDVWFFQLTLWFDDQVSQRIR